MKASRKPSRNNPRDKSSVVGKTKNLSLAPGVENSTVLTKRGRGQKVDIVIGIGHHAMPQEHIIRGLDKIAGQPVRTTVIRVVAGYPCALSRHIPHGTYALRTADRITAYRSETTIPVVSVPFGAAGRTDDASAQIQGV